MCIFCYNACVHWYLARSRVLAYIWRSMWMGGRGIFDSFTLQLPAAKKMWCLLNDILTSRWDILTISASLILSATGVTARNMAAQRTRTDVHLHFEPGWLPLYHGHKCKNMLTFDRFSGECFLWLCCWCFWLRAMKLMVCRWLLQSLVMSSLQTKEKMRRHHLRKHLCVRRLSTSHA